MAGTEASVFLAFLVVSTTSLLPFNLFMNAHEYFFYKLRNVSAEDNATLWKSDASEQTHLQHIFEGFVAFSSGIFCIFGALLNVLATNSVSNGVRVVGGHLTVLAALIPTLALTFIDTDQFQTSFFWATMILSAVASFGSMGLIGGGIMGLAATFPEVYVRSVMVGQAAAGVLSSGLSIICQAFARDEIINGRAYFAIAVGWTALSVLAYFFLTSSTLSREAHLRSSSAMDHRSLLRDDETEEEYEDGLIGSLRPTEPAKISEAWREVCTTGGAELLSALLVLLITLSAFPAVASLVVTGSHNETWQEYFSAVYCFLVFNLGDAFGRLMGSYLNLPRAVLVCASASRVVFPLLLSLCHVSPRLHPSLSVIPHDGIFLLIMIIFSVSNGALLTVSSIQLTRRVPIELREVAGSMFALVAASAALAGSIVGIILVGLI